MDALQIAQKFQKKEISPVEFLNQCFENIEKYDSKVQAFLEVEKEQALQEARESEERIAKGQSLSPYDGLPVGIKDNILQKDRKSWCASKILEGFIAPYSATVIEKLRSKGMIPIGRLNMDEFAMGSSTENSAYQKTKNPHDLERVPGGSSGGSAAAVSAGFLPLSLGSDTGGSIRQPAAFCGNVGLKPTYGSVSRYGLTAFSSSLDQIGPFAMTAEGARILYEVIAGEDKRDSTTIPEAVRAKHQAKIKTDLNGLKIGIPEHLLDGISKEVLMSLEKAKEFLSKELNAEVISVKLPHQKYGIPVYYIVANSEASANLARFDGIRYGRRAKISDNDLIHLYEASRTEGFGSEVKRRILIGTFALSSGYYDAYYGQALKVRELIRQDYQNVFEKVDVVLLPTTPSVAFKFGEKVQNPVEMYLSDVLTVSASLAGIPAVSVPGPTDGLPIGLQIQGPHFSENLILRIAQKMHELYQPKVASL
ncbi:MAG: Asp-tRNA(Asn)/Glu-tRNA(Gln) amidotransferase subunit GatA [Candidatus Hydrogenedentota bacterium]|nr:MAG: Asp-tRNA(Asn)/Glu-tRNA(Gln) amidotransferase subunit GatA [Candidatus Hydrogenedentota bacterium]